MVILLIIAGQAYIRSIEKFQKCFIIHIIVHVTPFFSIRCKKLLKGSSGKHHHSSRRGKITVVLSLGCLWFFYTQPYIYLLISVSLQVFTVSKDLVPRVLSKIVESVADEMCRLMQCVSSFSKNGALQVQCNTHR